MSTRLSNYPSKEMVGDITGDVLTSGPARSEVGEEGEEVEYIEGLCRH